MQVFTLDRKFLRRDTIDQFHSIIWTERYYGDSEVELVVPATIEMIQKLPTSTFLSIDKSNEVMILETMNIEDNKLKLTGISLLPWLNNRFIRLDPKHEITSWELGVNPGETPGWMLWAIIYYMCCAGSPYLNGTTNTGIPLAQQAQLVIPGLGLKDYDKSGMNVKTVVPYGPVYDAMREIATTYEIGMQITLESATDASYSLGFRSYKGLDRTSSQTIYPPVRFSPEMDSLTDIKELQSIAALKTLVYAFAQGLESQAGLTTTPGEARLTGTQYTGFDLRALMEFENLTIDQVGGRTNPAPKIPGDPAMVVTVLNTKAATTLEANGSIKAVDGEIVPTNQFKYGIDYNLGDIIEVQGNSKVVQTSRVTEYIRAQDEAGERAYPTVTMFD